MPKITRSVKTRRAPGEVRDAIISVLRGRAAGLTVKEVHSRVERKLGGQVAASSVRSYLQLGTDRSPPEFHRVARGRYKLRQKAKS